MLKVYEAPQEIFTNIVATAHSTYFNTQECSDVYLVLVGSNTPNWNVKIKTGGNAVDFTAAASPTNVWSYEHSKNTASDASIDGATGVTINNTTPVRLRINDFAVRGIVLEATRTAGNLHAWVERVKG